MTALNPGQWLSALARASLVLAMVGLALPSFADPPSHAPAHGWRKKNDPNYVGYTGRGWERDYGIVEGRCNRDAIGAVIGGVIGGAVGTQVGDGSGRQVAIIVGTVLGALIGREIGRNMDDKDRGCFGHALELGKDGQRVRWLNESTGVDYVLTPLAGKSGEGCRNYSLQVSRDGKSRKQEGRACRTGDGTWKAVQ